MRTINGSRAQPRTGRRWRLRLRCRMRITSWPLVCRKLSALPKTPLLRHMETPLFSGIWKHLFSGTRKPLWIERVPPWEIASNLYEQLDSKPCTQFENEDAATEE